MKWLYAVGFAASLILAPAVYAGQVDINTADAKTLNKELTGVGPKLAKAIVDYRVKHGAFKSADDLAKVKGVRKSVVEKNRANITLSANSATAAPAPAPAATTTTTTTN